MELITNCKKKTRVLPYSTPDGETPLSSTQSWKRREVGCTVKFTKERLFEKFGARELLDDDRENDVRPDAF